MINLELLLAAMFLFSFTSGVLFERHIFKPYLDSIK
jgi:hypothetical protein